MRDFGTIQEDLDAARSRRDSISDDLQRLELVPGEERDAGKSERADNLLTGLGRATDEIEALEDEYREALADGVSSGRLGTERGTAKAKERSRTRDHADPRLGRIREQALRSNERASFMPEDDRGRMEKAIRSDDDPDGLLSRYVVELSDRDYFRAFATWMRDPVSGGHEWSPKERESVQRVRQLERAMSIGTTTAGGFLIPYELDPSILLAGTGAVSPLRKIARVATTAYNEKRFVTSLGVTNTWTPEATEQTDDSPALLQPAITCKKAMAWVPVSFELYEDSDIAQQIGGVLADAKAVHEALSFTLTQTNGPVGIVTSLVTGASSIIATASNVLAIADLYTNQAALPPRWRPNASWMMSLPILNGYRQLAQATGLNYSIVNDSGPIPTALGWPIYENSSMDSTLTGATADYLVLSGDFQQFAIVDRVGTSIELVPQLVGTNHRPTGQRGFLMHYRSGSDVLIQDAFRLEQLLDLMAGKKLTARQQFVVELDGATVVVLAGAQFAASDPIVEAHREFFDPLPAKATTAAAKKK